MSLCLPVLVCCVLLLGPAEFTQAAESVQLVNLEGHVETSLRLPATFGNHEQGLNLELDGVAAQTASLRADLFQVAGGLAMPLAKNLHLQDAITLTNGSPQRLCVSIKFPDVKRRTEILIRLALIPNGPDANATQLGDIRFEVFPASVTQELKDLLQPKPNASTSVVVFGPGQKLRHFLTGLHLPFEDDGSGTPDRLELNRLYFGELTTDEQFQQAQDRSAGARLALFSADESLPAGVYAERSSSGTLVHVTAPLLDNITDDPRSQLAIIKIIRLLLTPSPSPTEHPL